MLSPRRLGRVQADSVGAMHLSALDLLELCGLPRDVNLLPPSEVGPFGNGRTFGQATHLSRGGPRGDCEDSKEVQDALVTTVSSENMEQLASYPTLVKSGSFENIEELSSDLIARRRVSARVGASPRGHMADAFSAEEPSATLGPTIASGWLASTQKFGSGSVERGSVECRQSGDCKPSSGSEKYIDRQGKEDVHAHVDTEGAAHATQALLWRRPSTWSWSTAFLLRNSTQLSALGAHPAG